MKIFTATFFLAGAATVVLAASRTSPPSGCLHVAKAGGQYTSVQAALDALSTSSTADQCVFVDQGTYTEQVFVAKRNARLTIYGYTTDTGSYAGNKATVTFNKDAKAAGTTTRAARCGWRLPTSRSTISTWSTLGSQAIALSAQASSGYYGCSFYGFQDTLLSNKGSQYYRNCMITGATDFIFGQDATSWFEQCDIRVRNGGYYITANGRDSVSNPSYYVFNKCDIRAASGESVGAGSYYLGRPWRTYSRVVFQNTAMTNVINGAGWHVWDGDQGLGNIYYGEYANTGAGASGSRVGWSKRLSSSVSISSVLGGSYETQPWYDGAYPGATADEPLPASTTTTTAKTTGTNASTDTPGNGGGDCAASYGQCGGKGFSGPFCCSSGACKVSNDWYSQCV
ncbi:carbohydrate esterase family 8 protein [Apiospora phragmitis]|uniref:Pectinesterase n=1 Tax=Apiospora phragmitis TaxID=2905665 RepID=A0ABR1WVW9_9PEZI